MTHVLILTDNFPQYERIRQLTCLKERIDVQFNFRRSPDRSILNPQDKMIRSALQPLDISADMDSIVEQYHLIISLHCRQIFPSEVVRRVRCINIHPGYNPFNRGWYPQVFSIVHDLPIGATIHEMDEQLDHGPIIARKMVGKNIWDTSLSLYKRVLSAELDLFKEYFDAIIDGTYSVTTPEKEERLFLKKDFQALCRIDLDRTGTFRQFYDLLRALSHGSYKNAYFTDPQTKKKVHINLDIEHD